MRHTNHVQRRLHAGPSDVGEVWQRTRRPEIEGLIVCTAVKAAAAKDMEWIFVLLKTRYNARLSPEIQV